jgi:DNA-binding MarR family transcriptional regulator
MKISRQNFIYTLGRVRQQAHAFLEEEMRREGVRNIAPSYGDVFVIVTVKGPMPMKDIARHTYKDKSTITGVVKSLEKHGYLKRVKDPSDGRASLISPTTKARKVMDRFVVISRRMGEKLFNGFSPEEMGTLFEMLERIIGNMKRSRVSARDKKQVTPGGDHGQV